MLANESGTDLRRLFLKIRWLLLILLLLGAGGTLAVRLAASKLQAEIAAALGANSEIGDIRLRWTGVEIQRLRIKAGRNWPDQDELLAERILVTPDLRSILSAKILIRSIQVDGAYLSLLRTTDGRLRILPSLLERPGKSSAGPMPEVSIGHIALSDAAITFYDASIRKPALAIRTEHIRARIDDVLLPSLAGHMAFEVNGSLKGRRRDGSVYLQGWAEIAGGNTETRTRLRGIDLLALQPYLIKSANMGVRQGSLDLDLDARVKARHLSAPGVVTLHHLELDPNSSSFMNLPRRAAIAAMQDQDKKIVTHFELSGDIDDPAFSLNENIASRFGTSLSSSLGISVEGVARGASSIAGTIGTAAAGAGRALKGLFGN